MAVPSFDSLMLPVLQTLVDGKIHRPQEVSDLVAARLGVSADDQAEMLPSGAMPRYRNRILWALHYMKRAGMIDETTILEMYKIPGGLKFGLARQIWQTRGKEHAC